MHPHFFRRIFRGPQIGYVLLGFVLASLIGLEREFRRKSAGLRTQAIVGTSAALLIIMSKYGFMDVLTSGLVRVDPSRVAAQSSPASAFSAPVSF